jgi:hypothetical protein
VDLGVVPSDQTGTFFVSMQSASARASDDSGAKIAAFAGSVHLSMRLLALIITPPRCAEFEHDNTSTTKVE